MEKEAQKRFTWIRLYEETGDAGLVYRRCGISRPTLRKWWKRYQELGMEGLKSQSKRPKNALPKKVFEQQENWILELRRERKLGVRRIQIKLERQQNFSLSLSTIQKVFRNTKRSPCGKSDGIKR